MKKLSTGQRKVSAEIVGNISVAWFSFGVIAPFFSKPENLFRFIIPFVIGLSTAVIFALFALYLVKGVKS